MTITLTPDQEKAIQDAIRSGVVRSVHEFIESAIGALPQRESEFDPEKASESVTRIRELRKGVRLDRRGMSVREMAHLGHRY
jgi:Arc/MetJ-type ribon-helix-helix transcriptional regulator